MPHTPNVFSSEPARGHSKASVVPGVLLIALMIGCGSYVRTHHVRLHNDTSRPLEASASFKGGNGTLNVPPGGDIHFTSQKPFDVEVSLPDGSRRRVRGDKYDSPDIRIVEGNQPYTVILDGKYQR